MRQGVLKAEHAPQSRVVLRAPPQTGQPVAAEPGIRLSQSELDSLRQQCLAEGREAGLQEGREEARQEALRHAEREARAQVERELEMRLGRLAREQAQQWRRLAAALGEQMQALRKQLEGELTEWTFIAVARLLGRRSPDDVAEAVRQVLAEARLDGPLTVLLNGQDLAAMGSEGWPAHLRFAADERVALGGCLVQSPVQTLDARLEVQLTLLRDSLDVARRQRAEGRAQP